jgi:hypothetical protein
MTTRPPVQPRPEADRLPDYLCPGRWSAAEYRERTDHRYQDLLTWRDEDESPEEIDE